MTDTTTASPFSGSRVLADGHELSTALKSGDWLDGGIAFFQGLGDVGAAIGDPIGTIASCGLGWVMSHLKPLSTWLEKLAGDADAVEAAVGKWRSVGTSMRSAGTALHGRRADLDGMSGATVTSYLAFSRDAATHLSASGDWADSVGTGLGTASQLVQKMQNVVKDAISKVIATAIEAMAVVAASFGLGMGYAIARVVTKVNELTNKVVKPVLSVLRSVKALTGLVSSVHQLFDQVKELVDGVGNDRPVTAPLTTGAIADLSGALAFGHRGVLDLSGGGVVPTGVDRVGEADAIAAFDARHGLGGGDHASGSGASTEALLAAGGVAGAAAVGGAVAGVRGMGLLGRPGQSGPIGGAGARGAGSDKKERRRMGARHRIEVVIEDAEPEAEPSAEPDDAR